MLAPCLVFQQARHVCIALRYSGHAETLLSCSRELYSLKNATTVASEAVGSAGSASATDSHSFCVPCYSGRDEPADSVLGWPAGIQPAHVGPCAAVVTSASLIDHFRAAPAGAGLGFFKPWRTDVLSMPARPCLPTRIAWAPTAAQLQLGSRSYHVWYHTSKIRNRDIMSASSLEQLATKLHEDSEKMDHINLVVFLRQLQLLGSHAVAKAKEAAVTAATSPAANGAKAKAGAPPGGPQSVAVAAAVAVASCRAVEQQVAILVQAVMRLVQRRTKWFDPRNAAAVIHWTAALGYTDRRVVHDMTARILARMNEAYSRDLMLMLRALSRHTKLVAAANPSSAPARPTTAAEWAAQRRAKQAAQLVKRAAELAQPGGKRPRWGAAKSAAVAAAAAAAAAAGKGLRATGAKSTTVPEQHSFNGLHLGVLDGVEHFLVAKIPTGRVPPENVDGLMRYLRLLPQNRRHLSKRLLVTAEKDLRARMDIYAPKPLAGLLDTLASEQHALPFDLLDSAAKQFIKHAAERGSGTAAARFLSAAAAMIQVHARDATATGEAAAAVASTAGAAAGGCRANSPGRWLSSRPELLTQCLRLMIRDMPGASPAGLLESMTVLIRAEVPMASLVSKATTGAGVGTSPPPTTTTTASAQPATLAAQAAVVRPLADPNAAVIATAATAAVSEAAAEYIRVYSAAVAVAAPRLSPGVAAKLRKAYDTFGLPYPKGL